MALLDKIKSSRWVTLAIEIAVAVAIIWLASQLVVALGGNAGFNLGVGSAGVSAQIGSVK